MLRSALLIDDTAQRRVASFNGRASTVNLLPVGDRTPEVPEEPSQKVLIIGDMETLNDAC